MKKQQNCNNRHTHKEDSHYENAPIQIYKKNSPPKTEYFQIKKKNKQKKTLIFFIFLLKSQIVDTL